MSKRSTRRAAERRARKSARKVADHSVHPASEAIAPAPAPSSGPIAAALSEAGALEIPEPGLPFPPLSALSPARLASNRANAQLSTGPASEIGRAISSQNRTTHGLARHNGAFRLLTTEDPAGFEALKQNLFTEHQPATETESILIDTMAEFHWLANRAQRLADSFIDPDTGLITNEKSFALYLRYQTTHRRAFHKSLNDLVKLKAEKRKADLGFEAQRRKEEDQRLKSERHEMKKQSHYWEVLLKDGKACHQIAVNTVQQLDAAEQNPGFEAQFAANLAAHSLHRGSFRLATSQTTKEEQAA